MSSVSYGAMILRIDPTVGSPGDEIEIADNSGSDLDAAPGLIRFNGPVSSFVLSQHTALSKPVLNVPGVATLDTISFGITVQEATSVEIWLTDTDFSLSPDAESLTLFSNIGGNIVGSGSITYQSFIDLNNNEFGTSGTSTPLQTLNNLTNDPFSDPVLTRVAYAGETFSLTHVIRLDLEPGAVVNFDATTIAQLPEPCTMALMGLGIGALGLLRRKKKVQI